jgi:D-psicose/D-tagatose/L-ribulose 3-epimerase
MRFGINAWLWVSPFTTNEIHLIKKAADLGFDWFEFGIEGTDQIDYAKVGEALKVHNLGVSVCAAMGPDRDLTIDDDATNRSGIEYLKHCIDAAVTCGSNRVVGPHYASVGRVWQADDEQRKVELDRCSKNLREAGKYAEDKGVLLCVESLNRFETSFINTTDQLLELIEMVDCPAVQVMADFFHMNIEEKDPAAAVEKMGSRLHHIHANDNDRGTPGTGHVDFEAHAKALKKIGYEEALVIESFSTKVKAIARAAAVWRPLAPSQDGLATEGLAYLKKVFA